MELTNSTTPVHGSPSTEVARISIQSLPLSSPPRLSNPTVENTNKDAVSSRHQVSGPCVVVECQSAKLSSVSNSDEKTCRICHVSSGGAGGNAPELIELGCGCKNGLGLAHRDCAEAWFKIKGNRYCEICGSDAKNILNKFGSCESIDIWHDTSDVTMQNDQISSFVRRKGFWIFTFLIFCFLIVFIVPWFFRSVLF